MSTLILGILLGWLIPRPILVGKIESCYLDQFKAKLPESITKHFG